MDKFNKVMQVIYWAMFIVVGAVTVLYCTVEKARSWLNRHVVKPYMAGCERLGAEILAELYDVEGSESEEK